MLVSAFRIENLLSSRSIYSGSVVVVSFGVFRLVEVKFFFSERCVFVCCGCYK